MPRSGHGWRRDCGPPAGQQGMTSALGGWWPWTARQYGAPGMHLLAALDQHAGAVPGQAAVDGKTNEITQFAPLLEPLDLAGCIIAGDVLHTQREHAQFLIADKKARYILVVKKNQPGLCAQVKNMPWRQIPVAARQHDRATAR
jgi:hypothetical protein